MKTLAPLFGKVTVDGDSSRFRVCFRGAAAGVRAFRDSCRTTIAADRDDDIPAAPSRGSDLWNLVGGSRLGRLLCSWLRERQTDEPKQHVDRHRPRLSVAARTRR